VVNQPELNRLAELLGVQLSYVDPEGNTHTATTKAKQAICRALGYPADTDLQIQKSLNKWEIQSYLTPAPSCVVIGDWEVEACSFDLVLPQGKASDMSWVLTREDASTQTGQIRFEDFPLVGEQVLGDVRYEKRHITLTLEVGQGYHTLSLLETEKGVFQIQLIVTPSACYVPGALTNGHRVWGFPVQLYALKSARNWGIGDFTDLKELAGTARNFGASLLGLNPINALFLDTPQEASPYAATSRIFLNPLYIDVDAIDEAAESSGLKAYRQSERFQEVLSYVQESDTVEYAYVSEIKLTALGYVFDTFWALHLKADGTASTPKGQAFLDFCASYGEELDKFAAYQILRQKAHVDGTSLLWWRWDKGYQDDQSPEMKTFQKRYARAILFEKYLQFVAFQQYASVGQRLMDLHFPIGLYTDLPVSVNLNSAEVWANQDLFLQDVSVGAPPDVFNKKGQDWALAAFNPFKLKETGYQLFRDILRSVMKPSGAVRIDHAFGLMRLYLQAKGNQGAYLTYPFKDMMGILALESQRNQCLVIGEDLGVPPPDFHTKMYQFQTLSFRLLRYQKQGDNFLPPWQYEPWATITAGTHDMPTYAAFWKGLDIDLYRGLKLISAQAAAKAHTVRIQERLQFIAAFRTAGLDIPEVAPGELSGEQLPAWFIPHAYTFLARSSSVLLLVRLEDVVEQEEQLNVPGTFLEYPNWRYKLCIPVESLAQNDLLIRMCTLLRQERPE